jgi:hypothetical protein
LWESTAQDAKAMTYPWFNVSFCDFKQVHALFVSLLY